jgi:hypothetical protein
VSSLGHPLVMGIAPASTSRVYAARDSGFVAPGLAVPCEDVSHLSRHSLRHEYAIREWRMDCTPPYAEEDSTHDAIGRSGIRLPIKRHGESD